jgi:hypothetical protein
MTTVGPNYLTKRSSPLSGDIGVDAGDPAQSVREQELGDGRNPVQVHW